MDHRYQGGYESATDYGRGVERKVKWRQRARAIQWVGCGGCTVWNEFQCWREWVYGDDNNKGERGSRTDTNGGRVEKGRFLQKLEVGRLDEEVNERGRSVGDNRGLVWSRYKHCTRAVCTY